MCKKHEWNLGSMLFDHAKYLIQNFQEIGVESIVFSGGDPFAHIGLIDLVELCGNMKVGILTAGNIYCSPENWERILKKVSWVRFSVDAYDAEIWKRIRGSTDQGYTILNTNLKTVSRLLEPLTIEEREKKVRLNMCILKGINEQEEIKVNAWARELGFNFMAHDTRVFEELMKKKEHHDRIASKCIIPFVHCIIETNGDVYPCCDVMNENASLENVNKQYRLGNLEDHDWNFDLLWTSQKATEIKKFFYEIRVKECETCPMRYYPANIEYEKQENEAIFL
jgi:radical SAM protein with 4Fe4S-binding SPASM domain